METLFTTLGTQLTSLNTNVVTALGLGLVITLTFLGWTMIKRTAKKI